MLGKTVPIVESAPALDHEVLRHFTEQGYPLNATLQEMLNEHYTHRTERRGAGFTQATRHLAALVNARSSAAAELRMFLAGPNGPLPAEGLRLLPARLELEESRLLAGIIVDLVFPVAAEPTATELPGWPDDLKIGTCPLAEKYFLELAEAFVRRKGIANILVSGNGEPLLLEKLKLGDDHSCVSLAPLVLNGVRLPPGSLLGARYEEGIAVRKNQRLPGQVIPVARCSGFRFLRLSTLAVAPAHRARAFTSHFQAQVDAGLFAPGEATIEQLRRLAQEQL